VLADLGDLGAVRGDDADFGRVETGVSVCRDDAGDFGGLRRVGVALGAPVGVDERRAVPQILGERLGVDVQQIADSLGGDLSYRGRNWLS